MEDRAKRIVELVRSGLSSEEIVRVFETEKALNVVDAVDALHKAALPAPEMKPKPKPVRKEHQEESLRSVCIELIPDEEWLTAPNQTSWELPLPRIANALKGAKGSTLVEGRRSPKRVVGSLHSHFRDRFGAGCVSIHRKAGDRIAVVTKVN